MPNVILATTMWSQLRRPVEGQQSVGEKREAEIRTAIQPMMLQKGCRLERFRKTYLSAWDIIGSLMKTDLLDSVRLQEEMVDHRRHLSETAAGVVLYDRLQTSLAARKEAVIELRETAMQQNDRGEIEKLTKECEILRTAIENTFKQARGIKTPLGQQIVRVFGISQAERTISGD